MIEEKAATLAKLLEAHEEEYKNTDIIETALLCLEYLTLNGLEDATRAAQIDAEISKIWEV